MKRPKHSLCLATTAALLLCYAYNASGQESTAVRMDDAYGDAFLNYQPYVKPGKKKEKEGKQTATAQTPEASPKKDEQRVDVEWLQKNYPILEKRAVDDPTQENVEALAYAKRIILDKAQRFEKAMVRAVEQDPVLNENNRIPYASGGAQAVARADYLAQQQAVREMSTLGGLLVFVDGSCRFCAMQLPIVEALKNNYGMEALVVTIDGTRPKGYTGRLITDNGYFKKLELKLTPSIVYVPSPKAFSDEVDPNKYLIVSQGYYAMDDLTKQIAYAGHSTKLLTQATMRDLQVWERGVASTEDLKSLRLDPNKPETFKKTLQPLLLKQYQ